MFACWTIGIHFNGSKTSIMENKVSLMSAKTVIAHGLCCFHFLAVTVVVAVAIGIITRQYSLYACTLILFCLFLSERACLFVFLVRHNTLPHSRSHFFVLSLNVILSLLCLDVWLLFILVHWGNIYFRVKCRFFSSALLLVVVLCMNHQETKKKANRSVNSIS